MKFRAFAFAAAGSCALFSATPLMATVTNTDTSETFATIQAAISDSDTLSGHTIVVDPGTYVENVTINKNVTLQGAQVGVDARGRVVGAPSAATESIIAPASGAGITLVGGSAGCVIDGFSIIGGSNGIVSTSGPITGIKIQNNHIAGATSVSMFLNDSGEDITIHQNVLRNAAGSSTTMHFDTDNFDGLHLTDNDITRDGAAGSTGWFVDGNRNVGPSGNRSPVISGNLFSNHAAGVNCGTRAWEGADVSNNVFDGNSFDGMQGGPKDCTISGNQFSNNGRYGLALTSFGNSNADRGAQGCTIDGNFVLNNGTAGILLSSSQAVGTISTNTFANNCIEGNTLGVTYSGTETIDMENNFWGDSTGPLDTTGTMEVTDSTCFDPPSVMVNADGLGDPITGDTVDYCPFLIACPFGKLTLEADSCQDDWDSNSGNGKQVAFELWMRDLPSNATGFQAFLLYDDVVLSFNSSLSSYSVAPFSLHITPMVAAEVGGGMVWVDGSDAFNGGGTSADSLLATLVFDVNTECGETSMEFDETFLFDSELSFEGDPIPTTLVNSSPIYLDDTAPIITCPPDVTVNCPEEAVPGVPFGTTTGGVAIYYNSVGGETPTNQAFLKAQCSNVYDPASNGAAFSFSTSPLDGYGTTWALIFNDLGQYGMDLVFHAPTSDNSVVTPDLLAVDWTGPPCNFTTAGESSWVVGDYQCASPVGPCNASTTMRNSPLRSPLGDNSPNTLNVTITRNDLTQSGSDFQAYIEGKMISDGSIHWFDPSFGSSTLASFGLPSDFYFSGTLDYIAANDTTPGMDFYEGSMTITLGGMTTLTGFATATDNCLQPVAVTFNDVNTTPLATGCNGDPIVIQRTWTATDACGNSSSCVQIVTIEDTTAPALLSPCPDDVVVLSEAGGCDAFVDWDDAVASENCDPFTGATISYEIDLDDDASVDDTIAISEYTFPAGTHRVTIVASDSCGNDNTSCSFLVTVSDTNLVDVEVELVGVFTPGVRCIHFVLDDCGSFADVPMTFVDHDSNGATPVRAAEMIEVPCGSWTQLCAKDEQHTLWATSGLSIVGTDYMATSLLSLEPGDNDNDGDVDINDVTFLIANFGSPEASGGCPFDGTRGTDFSNNGNVGSEDYSLLSSNWLTLTMCACTNPLMAPQIDVVKSIPIGRLDARTARLVDMNGDGVFDYIDVRLFEQRNRLPNTISNALVPSTNSGSGKR